MIWKDKVAVVLDFASFDCSRLRWSLDEPWRFGVADSSLALSSPEDLLAKPLLSPDQVNRRPL